MAEETNLEIEETGNSKKKLIVIIAAVLLVIVAAVVGYFLLSGSDTPAEALNDEAVAVSSSKGSPAKIGSALYVAMPRPFVFNIPGSSRDRTVQIKVELLVRGEANEETAKKHIPLIESTLLSIFSMTTADELSTNVGKENLRFAALEKVQVSLMDVEGSKVIERVLFTGFVMQ